MSVTKSGLAFVYYCV